MVKSLQVRPVTQRDLIDDFRLQFVEDAQFFNERQEHPPEIAEQEKELLGKAKAGFFKSVTYPSLLEKPVQEATTFPLLFLADLYLPPFHIRAEESVEISVKDDDDSILKGSLDVLILKEIFWLLVVEAKRLGISVKEGLVQLLAYLLANPNRDKPSFGLITNGASFLFVKLAWNNISKYATSDQFEMRRRGSDLYDVLRILKQIAHFYA